MQIVDTDVSILYPMKKESMYKLIEEAGRTAYKSESKITESSAESFILKLIQMGHLSVLEHANITVRYITDRATTHALVRHRIAAYTQESTIYCDYKKKGIAVRKPVFLTPNSLEWNTWLEAMKAMEAAYYKLRDMGIAPGIARDVLPNALKTELVATHNIREWRHILQIRSAKSDSIGMHLLLAKTYKLLKSYYPILFEDLGEFEAYNKSIVMEEQYNANDS